MNMINPQEWPVPVIREYDNPYIPEGGYVDEQRYPPYPYPPYPYPYPYPYPIYPPYWWGHGSHPHWGGHPGGHPGYPDHPGSGGPGGGHHDHGGYHQH